MLKASSSIVLLLLAAGCSSSSATGSPPDASAGQDAAAADAPPAAPIDAAEASTPDGAAIVAARPYTVHVPPGYDAGKSTPLVVMFHGFGSPGAVEESVLKLSLASDTHGFLYAYGEGTTDQDGNQFWNATDACCNTYKSPVDDVAYFDAIVSDMASKYNVDRKRVFAIGHSNGGFMAHRLACDRASEVAAIVALAGDNYLDATKCNPSEHVAVLQVHGDADMTILYGGGSTVSGQYPSAHASVATWAEKNGCTGALAPTGTMLDLDSTIPGNETKVETYGGCPAGVDVALWTIQGGPHVPTFAQPNWGDDVWGFFAAHPKP